MPSVDVKQAAEIIGTTERHIRRMCAADRLPGAVRDGATWRIPLSAHPRLSASELPGVGTGDLDRLDVPARKRDEAIRRAGLLAEFERFAAHAANRRIARKDAMARFCTEHRIGVRTLARWAADYKAEGIAGLIDSRGGCRTVSEMITPAAWDAFKSMYLTQQQLSIKTCWRNIQYINKSSSRGWQIPSYEYMVKYAAAQIPAPVAVLHREGLGAYEAKCAPYIESDPDSVEPGQIWVGDHHEFNCFIRHQGKWIRPWITAWQDMRSRAVVGRHISAGPNQTTVLLAMRQGVRTYGPPSSVKIDNGKDYDSEMWTGVTKRQRKALGKGYLDEAWLAGLYGMMDISVSFAIPYHPQAKCIERWFATLDDQFTRTMPTWAGKDTARKPEDLAEVLADPDVIAIAPDLDAFAASVDAYIAAYNAAPHTGRGMEGRSPMEVLHSRTSRRVVSDGVLDLLLRVWSPELTIGKNGVQFRSLRYGQYDPELLLNQGRKVRLSYDPEDLSTVHVYDAATMRLITIAGQNALVAYGRAVPEAAVREAMTQKGRALKIVKAHKAASRTANMDLTDITLRALADQAVIPAKAGTQPAPAIRPVATPLDDQVREAIKAELRKTVKKAAGAEQIREVLDFNFELLRQPKPEPIKLFDR